MMGHRRTTQERDHLLHEDQHPRSLTHLKKPVQNMAKMLKLVHRVEAVSTTGTKSDVCGFGWDGLSSALLCAQPTSQESKGKAS